MNRLVDNLILFDTDSSGDAGTVIKHMAEVFSDMSETKSDKELKPKVNAVIREILSLASDLKIGGNMWENTVAAFIAANEHNYKYVENRLMKNDCKILEEIFRYDFSKLDAFMPSYGFVESVTDKTSADNKTDAGKRIKELRDGLSASDDFYGTVCGFYKKYGSGIIGLNRAFTVETCESSKEDKKKIRLVPVKQPDSVQFDDLIGYRIQKDRLVENTEMFLKGFTANNVLLYGDAGTGKSTCIRALVSRYSDRGLKVIQIYRHQMRYLDRLVKMIRDMPYRFILYMDDLSFEDFETEYKYLKAVIEGGLDKKPDNVLIYATSNRRNLIKETWKDRDDMQHDGDIHRSDSMEEKQSLADRFGIKIFFGRPNKDEFYEMINILSEREGIKETREKIRNEANKWAVRNGISCRSARQFVDSIRGKEAKDK